MILIAATSGAVSGYVGLLISFHTGVPSGPPSFWSPARFTCFGAVRSRRRLVRQAMPRRHLEA